MDREVARRLLLDGGGAGKEGTGGGDGLGWGRWADDRGRAQLRLAVSSDEENQLEEHVKRDGTSLGRTMLRLNARGCTMHSKTSLQRMKKLSTRNTRASARRSRPTSTVRLHDVGVPVAP